ncbi:MAG: SPFH domain-containing protein [Proteobacteria bacterium]|nr:SPFH domain-containing protein [Pseudomonadota bacterium]
MFSLFLLLFFAILFGPMVFFIVGQQSSAVVERFGKFARVATPGLNIKIPFIEQVRGTVSLRLLQLDVAVETKTLDDVFVNIVTAVQYRIIPTKIYEAFYTLDDAERQIQAFVFDVIRARVPKIKLDDVFSKKDEIAISVREELEEMMNEFGYDIIKALVVDINPDARVKTAMNEINEAQRLRIAAMERGEAEKILKVKQAEAEAESKILQGKGMAGQRRAIIDGLKESLSEFKDSIKGSSTNDVMNLIMMTQYFDMLKDLGQSSRLNTLMVPHSPGGMKDLNAQLRDAIIIGEQMAKSSRAKPSETGGDVNS